MANQPSSLLGLRVVELPGSVALRYCGRLLAAHGATVWQAGAPDATGVGWGGAASAAYAAWLDAGKRPAPDLSTALAQAGEVELVLAGPGAEAIAGVDAALDGAGSTALRLGLGWFAADGPYRDWAGSDAVIQAMSGIAYATGAVDGLPMLPRGHAPQVVAGVNAFIAAVGGLIGQQRGWRSQHIDLDVLAANLCFHESAVASVALGGEISRRRGVNRFTPTYPGGIFRSADGWIGLTALTPPQWAALCEMIGAPALGSLWQYQVALQRLDDADALDQVLLPALAQRPSAWWLTQGQARRIPFAPVPTLADLPLTPHWQGRGSFASVPGTQAAVGPTQPFRFEPSGAPGPALAAAPPSPATPLAGLRVLDLSMGWAGPLAARHLADLGADVVKVESCSHVDWWRGFDAMAETDPPTYETRPAFLMVNRNKRGITLELKSPTGKALLRRLAAASDVMLENYAPGVLDKLGVGLGTMLASTPGLVAMAMGAFGNSGPWHGFRAYGSTVEQASGLPMVNGLASDPPTMQHVAYGDPVAGLFGAAAALLALYGRQMDKAGNAGGGLIDLGQVECLFQLGADAIIAQSVRSDALPRDGDRHPLSLLRMVAACAAPDYGPQWIALSVETAAQWLALARLVGHGADATLHPATNNPAALKAQEDALETAVRRWAGAQDAASAVAALQAAAVPAGPVRPASTLLDDPQLRDQCCWLDRPFIGRHLSTLGPARFDGQRLPVGAPAPTLGQANTEVLAGVLGLSADDIDTLVRDGVIGQRAIL